MGTLKKRFAITPGDNPYNFKMQTASTGFLKSLSAVNVAHDADSSPDLKADEQIGPLKVIRTIDLNEGALVELTEDQYYTFSRRYPGLRIKPELQLRPMKMSPARMQINAARLPKTTSSKRLTIRCIDAATRANVAGADIVVVFNRRTGRGIDNVRTDNNGLFDTLLPATLKTIDLVVAAPLAGYWPAQRAQIEIPPDGQLSLEIAVAPVPADARDCIDSMLTPGKPDDGKRVRIAIIDSGAAPIPGFNIRHAANMTEGEPETLTGDNGSGHGTHVAGIISRIAPGAELYIYRVFEDGAKTASEVAIAKAIRDATDKSCDIINLSLGHDNESFAISRATRRAGSMGAVCIAAAGNDGGAVSYPARSAHVTAISAIGVRGTWPDGASTDGAIATTPAEMPPHFFAVFSNRGDEIDLCGPGVGIISWVDVGKKGVMDGTSMACPAVAGLLARILSRDEGLLKLERDQARCEEILKVAFAAAQKIGFGDIYEGAGSLELGTAGT